MLSSRPRVVGASARAVPAASLVRAAPRRVLACRASSEPNGPAVMTLERAKEVLGLAGNPSWDQIVQAKNDKLSKLSGEQAMEVEAAYDALFSEVRPEVEGLPGSRSGGWLARQ